MENIRVDVGNVNKDIKTTIKNGTGMEFYGSYNAVYDRSMDGIADVGIGIIYSRFDLLTDKR
jgi:ABC-type Fe3+ transport system substrate-binding protein